MFKVEYGKGPKLDRWGYYLPEQPPLHTREFDTLKEAMEFAKSVQSKKTSANIYDLNGPKLDEDDDGHWLVGGWNKRVYYPNDNYERNGKY